MSKKKKLLSLAETVKASGCQVCATWSPENRFPPHTIEVVHFYRIAVQRFSHRRGDFDRITLGTFFFLLNFIKEDVYNRRPIVDGWPHLFNWEKISGLAGPTRGEWKSSSS